jgi:hypothetical protein
MKLHEEDRRQNQPEASFRRDFTGAAVWPIPYPAFAALVDMGMTDETIARYFRVSPQSVAVLRTRHDVCVASH